MTSREELRAKLHGKLRSQRQNREGAGSGPARSGSTGASGLDVGALMALAGDDPAMNQLVHSALSNPKDAVRTLSKTLGQAAAAASGPAAEPASDASDEEAPPDTIGPANAKNVEGSDEEGLPPSMESGAD